MKSAQFVTTAALLLALCPACKNDPAPQAKTEPPAAVPQNTAAVATQKPLLAAPGAGWEAPAMAEGTSAPPTVAEWQAAETTNTVGANSAPKDCVMKTVREWLKVNCTGNIKEVTNMEGFGREGSDFFKLVTPGKVADLVVRVKKGQAIKARIIREGQSASLFVNWPTQNPRPSIVALQIYNPG
ncbi:MAG: hypothetical protein U0359_42105 [Byssovorax sp.]